MEAKHTFTFSGAALRQSHRFVPGSKEPETHARVQSKERSTEVKKSRPVSREVITSVKMETLKRKYCNKNSSKVREIMVKIQATPAIKLEASP